MVKGANGKNYKVARYASTMLIENTPENVLDVIEKLTGTKQDKTNRADGF